MYSTKPGLPWKQTTKHSLSALPLSVLCEHIHHLWQSFTEYALIIAVRMPSVTRFCPFLGRTTHSADDGRREGFTTGSLSFSHRSSSPFLALRQAKAHLIYFSLRGTKSVRVFLLKPLSIAYFKSIFLSKPFQDVIVVISTVTFFLTFCRETVQCSC